MRATDLLRSRLRLEPEPAAAGSVAVVDIGSNSVRLVVYDGLTRAPVPMFNERAFCALGRDLAQSPLLGAKAMDDATRTITRFSRLARAMGVERLWLIATSAVRDAANRAEFSARIQESCGEHVSVISGEEEARISALGVISAVPNADGIMGDLGGGSLELVEITHGRIQRQATLPLGVLRLAELHRQDRAAAVAQIQRRLRRLGWLNTGAGRNFYPVGGAWRSIARLNMDYTNHPLHVVDGYRMTLSEMDTITQLVASLSARSLQRIPTIARRRRDALPLACDLLSAAVRRTGAKRVVFSAQGLREGFLFDRLPTSVRKQDPLIFMAEAMGEREARFGPMGQALFDWMEPLFKGRRDERRRLRLVSCHLADIGWREHPDYRAVQTMHRILRFPFLGLDHAERTFLAYAAYVRYGGDAALLGPGDAINLLSRRSRRRAEVIGDAQRLAFRVSGGARDVLERSTLVVDGDRLSLRLPADGSSPLDDAVKRQFDALVAATRMRRGRILT